MLNKKESMRSSTDQVQQADLYLAIINQEKQYSLWPNYKAIPEGWHSEFGPTSKEECLAYVDRVWIDMRPLSLRNASITSYE